MNGRLGTLRRPGKKRRVGTRSRARFGPSVRLDDPLGFLIPPGATTEGQLARELRDVMVAKRFRAGLGVPSVPTRYVVSLNPADRAALDPFTEDRLADSLTRHAERAGLLIVGRISVELEADPSVAPGRPRYWAGFVEDDLLVLADPSAAAEVYAGR